MKSIVRKCLVLLLASPLALSGCGGDDDDVTPGGGAAPCGPVSACGGDPTGSWSIEDACLYNSQPPGFSSDCRPEVDTSGSGVSGIAEFRSDGTFTMTSTLRGAETRVYPPACFSGENFLLTCAQLDEALKKAAAQEDSLYEAAECVAAGEDCACNVVYRETTTTTTTGTWSVSGTSLVLEREGREPQDLLFCVQGSSLALGVNAAGDADGAGPMTSYLWYTKD